MPGARDSEMNYLKLKKEEHLSNYKYNEIWPVELCSKVLWKCRMITVPRGMEVKETITEKLFFFSLGKIL